MPPAPFCLPGPHDIHNTGSVKLAEATRIRLILPGLNLAPSGRAEAPGSSKQSSKASGEAAAASAKAQKKLRKLQGIASQAEQAHAGIIVDKEVLEGSDSDGNEADEAAGAEGGSRAVHRSSTGSSGSEQDKRKGPGRAAAASTAAAGAVSQDPTAKGGRPRQRSLAAGKTGSSSNTSRGPDAAGQGSRVPASTSADGSTGVAFGSGAASCSSSNSSSRRGSGDKAHVPIWERSLPSGPAQARRTAAAAAGPKVLQTVALKTFSPTLGSFGPMLGDAHDTGQQDGAVASPSSRPPVLRSRSANRSPGGAASAPAALRKHTTPPYSKLSAAATAGAAAAPPLGVELPSVLRHVNFSSGASAYTPSQLLEKLILR